MKTRFKSEKHAREGTIGRALSMAAAAVGEKRSFSDREKRKVDLLLTTAETLELGKGYPREPQALIDFVVKASCAPIPALQTGKSAARAKS